MTKSPDKDTKHGPSAEITSRRTAMKRIAAALSGVAAGGAGLLGKATEAFGQYSSGQLAQRYISIAGSYVDTVYVSGYSSYNRYMSYYTSYRSHYSSVPPPSRYSSAR